MMPIESQTIGGVSSVVVVLMRLPDGEVTAIDEFRAPGLIGDDETFRVDVDLVAGIE